MFVNFCLVLDYCITSTIASDSSVDVDVDSRRSCPTCCTRMSSLYNDNIKSVLNVEGLIVTPIINVQSVVLGHLNNLIHI